MYGASSKYVDLKKNRIENQYANNLISYFGLNIMVLSKEKLLIRLIK